MRRSICDLPRLRQALRSGLLRRGRSRRTPYKGAIRKGVRAQRAKAGVDAKHFQEALKAKS